jgi:hypothetical protein
MESLADPCGDRVVTDLPPPPIHPIDDNILFPNSGNLNYFQN